MTNKFILGPLSCKNFPKNTDTIGKCDGRSFTKQHLQRTLANGQTVDRNWMIYSPSKNTIFCFVCRLFGSSESSDMFATSGLSHFHNINRDLKMHENSRTHILNELAYKTRSNEIKNLRLDDSFINHSEN